MTEKTPILDQVNLVVKDMDASVAFYERLGVQFDDGLPEWAPHHRTARMPGAIDLDLDSEAFAATWNAGWPGVTGSAAVLGFRLESREAVDRLYWEVTGAGYRGQQPPYDTFWGARYALVEDPDGNAVGLMSPVDPERRTPPPAPPRSD